MHHFIGLKHKTERREPQAGTGAVPRSPYVIALDKVTFLAGVIGPFTVLPQIFHIFATRAAQGVSLLSWVLMFIVTLPWVFYGAAHRDRSIVVSFILWEIMNALVVVGVLMYR